MAVSSAATRRASGSREHSAARLGRRVRVGIDSDADERAQQLDRLRVSQRIQVQPASAVPGNQARHRIAAGHDDGAGRGAW